MATFERAPVFLGRVRELGPVELLVLVGHVLGLHVQLASCATATEHGPLGTVLVGEELCLLRRRGHEHGRIGQERRSGRRELLELHPEWMHRQLSVATRLRGGHLLVQLGIDGACDSERCEEDCACLHCESCGVL